MRYCPNCETDVNPVETERAVSQGPRIVGYKDIYECPNCGAWLGAAGRA